MAFGLEMVDEKKPEHRVCIQARLSDIRGQFLSHMILQVNCHIAVLMIFLKNGRNISGSIKRIQEVIYIV